MQVICTICGKTFDSEDMSTPGNINGQWYCSDSCADKAFLKKCVYCGKQFNILEGEYEWFTKGYCSENCMKKHSEQKLQAEKLEAEKAKKAAEEAEKEKARKEAEAKKKAEEEARQKQIAEERKKAKGLAQLETGKITYTFKREGTYGEPVLHLSILDIKNNSIFSSGDIVFRVYFGKDLNTPYDDSKSPESQNFAFFGASSTTGVAANSSKHVNLTITTKESLMMILAEEQNGIILIYQKDSNNQLSFIKHISFRPTIEHLSTFVEARDELRIKKIIKKAIIIISTLTVIIGTIAVFAECGTSSKNSTAVENTTKNKVNYTPGPKDTKFNFTCDSISIDITPKKNNASITLNKLFHKGTGKTGALRFALYLLPQQYNKGQVLNNRILTADLHTLGIEVGQGWNSRELSSLKISAKPKKGDYYLVGTVLNYNEDNSWSYTNIFDFGPVNWNPDSSEKIHLEWKNKPYVVGSKDKKTLKMNNVSVHWDHQARTATIHMDELRNTSNFSTGSLMIGFYTSDEPYKEGKTIEPVATEVISNEGLKQGYGWNDKTWTLNYQSKIPDAGKKYLCVIVKEYAEVQDGKKDWTIRSWVTWKDQYSWNPQIQK